MILDSHKEKANDLVEAVESQLQEAKEIAEYELKKLRQISTETYEKSALHSYTATDMQSFADHIQHLAGQYEEISEELLDLYQQLEDLGDDIEAEDE